MSKEVQQFLAMVKQEYNLIEYGKLEKAEILLNIAEAERKGEITHAQAQELRDFYERGL